MDSGQVKKLEELKSFKEYHGIPNNWHEPDQQEIVAKVTGTHLDNTMGEQIKGEEFVVILYKDYGDEGGLIEKMRINLATLFALASRKE